MLYSSLCNIIFLPSGLSGNTYDRCILVDEEEASIVLYDIWEQVSHISFMFVRLLEFLGATCLMLILVSFFSA